jgi:hypothetical protein
MSEREFRDKLRFHLGCYHLLAAQKRRVFD